MKILPSTNGLSCLLRWGVLTTLHSEAWWVLYILLNWLHLFNDILIKKYHASFTSYANWNSSHFFVLEKDKEVKEREAQLFQAKATIAELQNRIGTIETSRKRQRIEYEHDVENVKKEATVIRTVYVNQWRQRCWFNHECVLFVHSLLCGPAVAIIIWQYTATSTNLSLIAINTYQM